MKPKCFRCDKDAVKLVEGRNPFAMTLLAVIHHADGSSCVAELAEVDYISTWTFDNPAPSFMRKVSDLRQALLGA